MIFDCHIQLYVLTDSNIEKIIHLIGYIYIDSELFVEYDYTHIIFRGTSYIKNRRNSM